MKKEIEKGNAIIKSFVGDDFHNKLCYQEFGIIDYSQCVGFYNDSWNWIMPVVEKISEEYDVTICSVGLWICEIKRKDSPFEDRPLGDMGGYSPMILNVFYSVLQFIKWHNESKRTR